MIRLRPYKTKDAYSIVNWISQREEFFLWCADLIDYPFNIESMNKLSDEFDKDDKGCLVTAIDNSGVPVGFAALSKADFESNNVHLGFVLVDNNLRGQRMGIQLIESVKKYCFDILNFDSITLKVFSNNTAAVKCYLSCGFNETSRQTVNFSSMNKQYEGISMICKKQKPIV